MPINERRGKRMRLGETIRTLRTKKNLSQSDLAEALDVSRQSISKWETDGAVPDLDKLVRMSEVFGVTLDALVHGEGRKMQEDMPQGAAAEQAAPRPPHRVAGTILLCTGALIALLLFFLGGGLFALLCAIPFLLCGIICLCALRRIGLWCAWTVFLCVDLYLRYGTGITWEIILLTLRFTPEMNYMRLIIGWCQFLAAVLLVICTLRSYRGTRVAWNGKHIAWALVGWGLLCALTLVQRGMLSHLHSLPYEQVDEMWYFWLRACGDFLRLGLFTVLLIVSAALVRQRRARQA